MKVTWLGHASVVIDLGGVRLLADPLLSRHNGALRRRYPMPDKALWRDPDAVLISHMHYDHVEMRSLRLLGDIPMLTAPDNAAWLRTRGIAGGTGLGTDEWYDVPDRKGSGEEVRVRLVKADHQTRPLPSRPSTANGHIVKTASIAAWVAGDTGLYDEMAELPNLAGRPIDVALVPVGGWGVRLPVGHMGPEQAAEACARVGARVAIPVHWGTLHTPLLRDLPRGWMDRPGDEFLAALAKVAPDCQGIVLEPGEAAEID